MAIETTKTKELREAGLGDLLDNGGKPVPESLVGPNDDTVTREATARASDSRSRWQVAAQAHDEVALKHFAWEHLPEGLQGISRPFGALALALCTDLPKSEERSVAIRKLLEAKDAAVRAKLP